MWAHTDWGRLSLDGAGAAADHDADALLTDYTATTGEQTGEGASLSVDDATGKITIGTRSEDAGYYLIIFAGSFLGSNGKTIDISLKRNTTAVNGGTHLLTALTGQLTQHVCIAVAVYCHPGDYLGVWANASDATNWTPTDLSFFVIKIA